MRKTANGPTGRDLDGETIRVRIERTRHGSIGAGQPQPLRRARGPEDIDNLLDDQIVETRETMDGFFASRGRRRDAVRDGLRLGASVPLRRRNVTGKRKTPRVTPGDAERVVARLAEVVGRGGYVTLDIDNASAGELGCYTIGLTERDLPELVLFGGDRNYGAIVFAEVLEHVSDEGALPFGRKIALTRFASAVLLEVPIERALPYMGAVDLLYEPKEVRCAQVVLDHQGKFPWDDGYAASHAGRQRILGGQ